MKWTDSQRTDEQAYGYYTDRDRETNRQAIDKQTEDETSRQTKHNTDFNDKPTTRPTDRQTNNTNPSELILESLSTSGHETKVTSLGIYIKLIDA